LFVFTFGIVRQEIKCNSSNYGKGKTRQLRKTVINQRKRKGEKMKQNEAENKLLRIGQLAKQTGELVTTIRFWTNEGLLEVKEYSQGGYQLYEPSMIERVKEVRRLQNEKRLTIAEIKEQLGEAKT